MRVLRKNLGRQKQNKFTNRSEVTPTPFVDGGETTMTPEVRRANEAPPVSLPADGRPPYTLLESLARRRRALGFCRLLCMRLHNHHERSRCSDCEHASRGSR